MDFEGRENCNQLFWCYCPQFGPSFLKQAFYAYTMLVVSFYKRIKTTSSLLTLTTILPSKFTVKIDWTSSVFQKLFTKKKSNKMRIKKGGGVAHLLDVKGTRFTWCWWIGNARRRILRNHPQSHSRSLIVSLSPHLESSSTAALPGPTILHIIFFSYLIHSLHFLFFFSFHGALFVCRISVPCSLLLISRSTFLFVCRVAKKKKGSRRSHRRFQ